MESRSYKVEVQAGGDPTWTSNALRFATFEQARIYGQDLACRWASVYDWRCTESDDPPNRGLDDVKTKSEEEMGTSPVVGGSGGTQAG